MSLASSLTAARDTAVVVSSPTRSPPPPRFARTVVLLDGARKYFAAGPARELVTSETMSELYGHTGRGAARERAGVRLAFGQRRQGRPDLELLGSPILVAGADAGGGARLGDARLPGLLRGAAPDRVHERRVEPGLGARRRAGLPGRQLRRHHAPRRDAALARPVAVGAGLRVPGGRGNGLAGALPAGDT